MLNFVYNIEWRTQTKAHGEHTPQKCRFGSDNFLKGCFSTLLDHTPKFLPKDRFFSLAKGIAEGVCCNNLRFSEISGLFSCSMLQGNKPPQMVPTLDLKYW